MSLKAASTVALFLAIAIGSTYAPTAAAADPVAAIPADPGTGVAADPAPPAPAAAAAPDTTTPLSGADSPAAVPSDPPVADPAGAGPDTGAAAAQEPPGPAADPAIANPAPTADPAPVADPVPADPAPTAKQAIPAVETTQAPRLPVSSKPAASLDAGAVGDRIGAALPDASVSKALNAASVPEIALPAKPDPRRAVNPVIGGLAGAGPLDASPTMTTVLSRLDVLAGGFETTEGSAPGLQQLSVPTLDSTPAGTAPFLPALGSSRSPGLPSHAATTGRKATSAGATQRPGRASILTATSSPAPTSATPSHPDPSPGNEGGPAGSFAPPSGGFFFFGFVALLLGLSVLAGQARSRRLRSAPASWRPVPFVSLLERPG